MEIADELQHPALARRGRARSGCRTRKGPLFVATPDDDAARRRRDGTRFAARPTISRGLALPSRMRSMPRRPRFRICRTTLARLRGQIAEALTSAQAPAHRRRHRLRQRGR